MENVCTLRYSAIPTPSQTWVWLSDQRGWDGPSSGMYAEVEKRMRNFGGETWSEETGHLENLGSDEEIILKADFEEMIGVCGLDSYGSG